MKVRGRVLTAAALMVILASAGCFTPHDASRTMLRGTFTPDASQEQMQGLGAEMRARGADVLFLESFPVQFQVRGLAQADCPDARERIAGLPFVSNVSECREA